MALTSATLEKSYTTSANNVTAYSSGISPCSAMLYRLKVELMKVPGATVVQSCDGTSYGASDLWTGADKVALATSGNRSWIVIKFDNTANDATVMLSSLVNSTSDPNSFGAMTISFNGATDTYGTYATNSNPACANAYTFTFGSLASYTLANQVPVVSSVCYSSDGKSFTAVINQAHNTYTFGLYEGVMYDQQATSFDAVLLKNVQAGGASISGETVVARIGGANSTLAKDVPFQQPFITSRQSGGELLLQPSFHLSNVQRYRYVKDVYTTCATSFSYQFGTLFQSAQDPALMCVGEYMVPWTGPSPTVWT
jgi:hypothetical protein